MFHRVFEYIDFADPVVNAATINVLNSLYGFNVETSRVFPLILRGGGFYVVHTFSHSFNDSFSTVDVDYLLARRDLAGGGSGPAFQRDADFSGCV